MTLLKLIVLYGAETLDTKKNRRTEVIFERKVPRKMYVPVFDSQTKKWRKLHNNEL